MIVKGGLYGLLAVRPSPSNDVLHDLTFFSGIPALMVLQTEPNVAAMLKHPTYSSARLESLLTVESVSCVYVAEAFQTRSLAVETDCRSRSPDSTRS